MRKYDETFFAYIEGGALRSASVLAPHLISMVDARSVADFGCGRGAWLKIFRKSGIADVVGVDGPYVTKESLLIPTEFFRAFDLTRRVDLGRRFDLVTSFEVGEHLPTPASPDFVDNLCRHGDVVAFSAAAPGQGGEHHVNEQPYEFWRDLFALRGYRLFDCIRPRIADNANVEPWYRYNALLFVADNAVQRLSADVLRTEIASGAPVPDVSPGLFKLRKLVLRHLTVKQVDRIAVAKHILVLAKLRLQNRFAVPANQETASASPRDA